MRPIGRLTMPRQRLYPLSLLTALLCSGLFALSAVAGVGDWSHRETGSSGVIGQFHAQPQPDCILLQWRPVVGADGYRIYHQVQGAADGNSLWFDVAGDASSARYSEVQTGVRVAFRIAALHGHTQGPLSHQASAVWQGAKTGASDSAP